MKSLFFKDIKIGCKIYFFVRGVSFLFINSQAFRQNLNIEKSHKLIYNHFHGKEKDTFLNLKSKLMPEPQTFSQSC